MPEPVEKYLIKVKSDLIAQQRRLGFWASGRTADSLKIVEDKRFKRPEAVFKLQGDRRANIAYATMQKPGRKAGKWPPPQSIQRWINQKKINLGGQSIEQVSYLIGRKLAQEGNQVKTGERKALNLNNIVEKNLPSLLDDIADDTADRIVEIIDKTLPVKR